MPKDVSLIANRIIIGNAEIYQGSCLQLIRLIPDCSIDSIVTDPPYELGFMNKKWDSTGIAFNVDLWREALRVLKPGGYLLAFSGTRTYHRLASAIEDAGFEVRDRFRYECGPSTKYGALWDSLNDEQKGALLELLNDQLGYGSEFAWEYGNGFPKNLDIGKAIDKAAGATRSVLGPKMRPDGKTLLEGRGKGFKGEHEAWHRPWKDDPEKVFLQSSITAPATEHAIKWDGWGTALKPAYEPICVARKPMKGTVAANIVKYGTGGLNIDACRVPSEGGRHRVGEISQDNRYNDSGATSFSLKPGPRGGDPKGRWPANVLHDGSNEVVASFAQLGDRPGIDSGERVARFFYCAKTSSRDRHEGCENPGPQFKHGATLRKIENVETKGNNHPTVKPTALMRYLCRMVTPPGGKILDLFVGSGSTGKACAYEGFSFVGMEIDPVSVGTSVKRISWAQKDAGARLIQPIERVDQEDDSF